jgi:hypothetical protein
MKHHDLYAGIPADMFSLSLGAGSRRRKGEPNALEHDADQESETSRVRHDHRESGSPPLLPHGKQDGSSADDLRPDNRNAGTLPQSGAAPIFRDLAQVCHVLSPGKAV